MLKAPVPAISKPAPGATPFPGAQFFGPNKKNDYILMLDKALIAKGYTKYYAKGAAGASRSWGKGTQNAVKAFQMDQGWTGEDANGIPGPETWKRLGLG
jgi:peptidoglycan hydrolase-like protein with peptidoglycan-binding domain